MNFDSDEPDYREGKEECVSIQTDGTWYDEECDSLYRFVCFSGKNKT